VAAYSSRVYAIGTIIALRSPSVVVGTATAVALGDVVCNVAWLELGHKELALAMPLFSAKYLLLLCRRDCSVALTSESNLATAPDAGRRTES